MLNKRQQGAKFEYRARLFLQAKGLIFISANQQFKNGEIDLIMRDNTTFIFVEVRQRKSDYFGDALSSVNRTKQRKWMAAAQQWLLQHHGLSLDTADCRFDLVTFDGEPPTLTWHQNFLESNY